MEKSEILRTKEQVRKIANSIYICIPSYLVRSREIIPGDPVSVRVMSDGSLNIEFEKEVEK
jgi:antitoxin component of MazEF toxin-antitoxin module